jgi:hypothetical protein
MGRLVLLVAAALAVPAGSATAHTVTLGASSASAAAAVPDDDPARGLIYEGLVAGSQDGPCGGLFEVRSDDRALEGCSHGPDPAPAGDDVREPRSLDELSDSLTNARPGEKPPAPPLPCHRELNGDAGNRVHAIYAYPSDLPGGSRFAQVVPLIRRMAAEIDQIFVESARKTRGRRHVRFLTSGCQLVIDEVSVSPRRARRFSRTVGALRAQGYNRPDRKYVVWMDVNPSVYCGIGHLRNDRKPTQDNLSNGHPSIAGMFARIDPKCWGGTVEAHELMHTLGGVQTNAPHASVGVNGVATFGGHCTDEYDRMCYDDDMVDDGRNRSTVVGSGSFCNPSCTYDRPMTYGCEPSQDVLFDCGDDDYFHTSPPSGAYLETNWNTANSSFLDTRYLVDRDPPEVTAPVHVLADRLGPDVLPYSITWSARDASGISDFHLWQYQDSTTTSGAWGSELVIPSGAGDTGNWIDRAQEMPLPPSHGYKFAVRAVDWARNSSDWLYGSYFWPQAHEETNPAITYSGNWSQVTSAEHFNGGSKRTTAAASQATFTFSGWATFIAWVGTLDPTGGSADVFLDGVKVQTVSLTAPASSRRILFRHRFPHPCTAADCPPHTITVRAGGGGMIDVDTFVVEETGS